MLAMQGGDLYRKHTYAALAPRNREFHGHPHLKKLRALAEEGDESSQSAQRIGGRTQQARAE